jgi:hypothetical protein
MLDIHRDIVYEFLFYERSEHIWIVTVGIEFYPEPEGFDLGTELSEVSMYRRFTATY